MFHTCVTLIQTVYRALQVQFRELVIGFTPKKKRITFNPQLGWGVGHSPRISTYPFDWPTGHCVSVVPEY